MIIEFSESNKPYVVTYGMTKGKIYISQTPIKFKPIRYSIRTIHRLDTT